MEKFFDDENWKNLGDTCDFSLNFFGRLRRATCISHKVFSLPGYFMNDKVRQRKILRARRARSARSARPKKRFEHGGREAPGVRDRKKFFYQSKMKKKHCFAPPSYWIQLTLTPLSYRDSVLTMFSFA